MPSHRLRHTIAMQRATRPAAVVAACLVACHVAWHVAWLSTGSAAGADRVRMLEDNVAEIGVRDCLKTAAQAVSEENLDAFVDCFTERQRSRLRRKAAVLFATHVVDLELLDSHVLSESASRAELAVKYRATLSDDSYDIVSVLAMVKEDDAWRIAREKVESNTALERYDSSTSIGGPVFRFGGGDAEVDPGAGDVAPAGVGRRKAGGCANGRCGL